MGDGRRRTALLTWADRLVLYALVGCGVVLFAVSRGGGGAGGSARIRGEDGYDQVVRLDEDARYEVPGPLGASTIEIRGGSVRMVSSPCPEHVCERMGSADAAGETIVCVPNGVAVTILGVPERRTDALTR